MTVRSEILRYKFYGESLLIQNDKLALLSQWSSWFEFPNIKQDTFSLISVLSKYISKYISRRIHYFVITASYIQFTKES